MWFKLLQLTFSFTRSLCCVNFGNTWLWWVQLAPVSLNLGVWSDYIEMLKKLLSTLSGILAPIAVEWHDFSATITLFCCGCVDAALLFAIELPIDGELTLIQSWVCIGHWRKLSLRDSLRLILLQEGQFLCLRFDSFETTCRFVDFLVNFAFWWLAAFLCDIVWGLELEL